jgi:hypothetical protein
VVEMRIPKLLYGDSDAVQRRVTRVLREMREEPRLDSVERDGVVDTADVPGWVALDPPNGNTEVAFHVYAVPLQIVNQSPSWTETERGAEDLICERLAERPWGVLSLMSQGGKLMMFRRPERGRRFLVGLREHLDEIVAIGARYTGAGTGTIEAVATSINVITDAYGIDLSTTARG